MISKQLGRRALYFLYSSIKVSIDKHKQAAFLTLSNPKKRNPLSLDTLKQIFKGLQ